MINVRRGWVPNRSSKGGIRNGRHLLVRSLLECGCDGVLVSPLDALIFTVVAMRAFCGEKCGGRVYERSIIATRTCPVVDTHLKIGEVHFQTIHNDGAGSALKRVSSLLREFTSGGAAGDSTFRRCSIRSWTNGLCLLHPKRGKSQYEVLRGCLFLFSTMDCMNCCKFTSSSERENMERYAQSLVH